MDNCYIVMVADVDGALIDKVYVDKEEAEDRASFLEVMFSEKRGTHWSLDKMDEYAKPMDADWRYFGCGFSVKERELNNRIGGAINEQT